MVWTTAPDSATIGNWVFNNDPLGDIVSLDISVIPLENRLLIVIREFVNNLQTIYHSLFTLNTSYSIKLTIINEPVRQKNECT